MIYIALAVIVFSAEGFGFHHFESCVEGFAFAVRFRVSDDFALVVKLHERAYAENRADERGDGGNPAAALEKRKVRAIKLMMNVKTEKYDSLYKKLIDVTCNKIKIAKLSEQFDSF